MRRATFTAVVLVAALATFTHTFADDPAPLRPYPGTGMFLLLSDIHFDPYDDPGIMRSLGAVPRDGCRPRPSGAFSNYGVDTNYPLLKSTLDNAVATAATNGFHYDYVIVTGDFLAHSFDASYRECVGTDVAAYQKFAGDTIAFVYAAITKALPGIPVFATLGNNDSDQGDYQRPTPAFLERVGQEWSRTWVRLPAEAGESALASFRTAGFYALPHPTAPHDEIVVLNSNLWSANNSAACGDSDPDPGGQFRWLADVLGHAKHRAGTATLVMHIFPGIDVVKSSMGPPQTFWTDACTGKLIEKLTQFRGVVREIYAGHIHRDDFRLFPDTNGRPLALIHVVPAVSPVYLNNPAVQIGWYDRNDGEMRDFAALYLDLRNPQPAWETEYVFTQSYGLPRPNLAAIRGLTRDIHDGNPGSGVGEKFAKYFGAGVSMFLSPANWSEYSCAQTEMILSHFTSCTRARASNVHGERIPYRASGVYPRQSP